MNKRNPQQSPGPQEYVHRVRPGRTCFMKRTRSEPCCQATGGWRRHWTPGPSSLYSWPRRNVPRHESSSSASNLALSPSTSVSTPSITNAASSWYNERPTTKHVPHQYIHIILICIGIILIISLCVAIYYRDLNIMCQSNFNDIFIYCMLFYSLYVQLLSFSFTVICAVYFCVSFFSFTVICVDWVFHCLLPSGVLNK